ncbi:MAG: hypothetical protein HC888_09230 [Candidatus Competibacteraceae bacterium]|nr:hypothetical protein [Candidatus Competibacteraceae bacterium]
MKSSVWFTVMLVIPLMLYAQVSTDYEAKSLLRDWGVYSSRIIENAERIIIESGSIEGEGGMCISLPILYFVQENDIVLLNGASGYRTKRGTIVIEADLLNISGVVININGRTYFIVGKSLKDIVNYLTR